MGDDDSRGCKQLRGSFTETPIADIDAEQAVIGCLLIRTAALHEARDILDIQDFWHGAHRRIWAAACKQVDSGFEADIITLQSALNESGHLKEVGGLEYLHACIDRVPTSVHVRHYAAIVRDKSLRRQLEAFGARTIPDIARSDSAIQDVVDTIFRGFDSIASRAPERSIDAFEAEASCLGAALVCSESADLLLASLSRDDFNSPANRAVYDALRCVRDDDCIPDFTSVQDAARRNSREVSLEYLASLANSAGTGEDAIRKCAAILKDMSARRKLRTLGATVARRAEDLSVDTSDSISSAAETLAAISTGQASDSVASVVSGTNLDEAWGNLVTPASSSHRVYTGLPTLDRMTRGPKAGELWVIAARPSIGKSDFCLALATHTAKQLPVLLISLEMSEADCLARLVSNSSRVPYHDIHPEMDASLRERVEQHYQIVKQGRIRIADLGRLAARVDDVSAFSSGFLARCGYGLIIIDQLNVFDEPGENGYAKITRAVRGLKNVAGRLQVPILLQCQLSRNLEHRSDPTPRLSDLRDSGAIEEAASTVIMLTHNKGPLPWDVRVIVAKQRQGPLGEFIAKADTSITRWWEEYRGPEDIARH